VEVSNNRGLIPRAAVNTLIAQARACGLRVFGEVGSEVQQTAVRDMVKDIHECLTSGAEMVYVECTDLVEQGRFEVDRAKALAAEAPVDQLIFELPGWWVRGVSGFEVHHTMVQLVEQFGSDVNIGNVDPDDVLLLECVRRNFE
jgi:phosphosulfolactate synthase (CoM biosynthesis protein A)